jgi:hypothetical protein
MAGAISPPGTTDDGRRSSAVAVERYLIGESVVRRGGHVVSEP